MSGPEEENWSMVEMDYDEDDDNDDCAHFPDNFKNYMKTKLTWQHLKPMGSWVFWSEEVESESPPPIISSCVIPISEPEILISNWRIEEKIRSVIQKLISQCERYKFSVLIQFWAPRTVADRCILTTADQPFGLSSIDDELCQFRMMSVEHKFYVDAKGADDPGLLGHVFQQNVPAFTPAVRYYSREEYPQRDGAIDLDVQASMSFPVIEPSGACCFGVLELLATKEIYSYSHGLSKVLSAVQDVGLKYSDVYGHTYTPVSKGQQQVLEEISKAVKLVCETHKLPGQTWIPCRCCRDVELGGSCGGYYVSCKGQVMTTLCDTKASYALDDNNRGFLEACSANFLRKGQGVAGKALSSPSAFFCLDVTRFSIIEYPLVHLARMFGLTSCFAICLRSTYTGDADYVTEFFLPPKRKGGWDPRTLLGAVLETMKQNFQSFKVASGEELGQKLFVEVIKFSKDSQTTRSPRCQEALRNVEMVLLDSSTKQTVGEADAINNGNNVISQEQINSDVIHLKKDFSVRTLERKNRKPEITKEVLEQHFGVQLDAAAQELCISRSKLKRICRKHGIERWPCHKRTKRNGSLAELKQVNESVGGAEGAANLTATFQVPGTIVSAQHEKPLGEMLIENEQTSQMDLELHLTVPPVAAATVLDAVISTQLETSIGGKFTENTGPSHEIGNLYMKLEIFPLHQQRLVSRTQN